MDDYYPGKNQEINLKFSADVAYGANIDQVTINEETYEVEKLPDTNDYTVKFVIDPYSDNCSFRHSARSKQGHWLRCPVHRGFSQ